MADGHPSWEELIDIATGNVTDAARDHVNVCTGCRNRLRAATEVVVSLEAAGAGDPSPAAVNRAIRAIAADAPETLGDKVRAAVDVLRETLHDTLAAALVADSWAPTVAVRGATTAWPRVLVYETDEHSISLSMTPGGRERTTSIVGQVVPREAETLPSSRRATLTCEAGEVESALSEFGEFTFTDARGAIRLDIVLGNQPITIAPLPDGHDAPESP